MLNLSNEKERSDKKRYTYKEVRSSLEKKNVDQLKIIVDELKYILLRIKTIYGENSLTYSSFKKYVEYLDSLNFVDSLTHFIIIYKLIYDVKIIKVCEIDRKLSNNEDYDVIEEYYHKIVNKLLLCRFHYYLDGKKYYSNIVEYKFKLPVEYRKNIDIFIRIQNLHFSK